MHIEFISSSVEETKKIAESFASGLKGGECIALYGDLGAGKTAFSAGIAAGLGIKQKITSPTFTILNQYDGRIRFYHFDLYRISDPEELYEIGWEDALASSGVCAVEWCENAGDLLPADAIRVKIDYIASDKRRITISSPEAS